MNKKHIFSLQGHLQEAVSVLSSQSCVPPAVWYSDVPYLFSSSCSCRNGSGGAAGSSRSLVEVTILLGIEKYYNFPLSFRRN